MFFLKVYVEEYTFSLKQCFYLVFWIFKGYPENPPNHILSSNLHEKSLKWSKNLNHLGYEAENFGNFLFSMRLSNGENFKDFKIFDLTWIWWIWPGMSQTSSGDKPILTLKISVKLSYFDIKIRLLGQNNFEWICFC